MNALQKVVALRVPLAGRIPTSDRLIVALDVPTVNDAKNIVRELGDTVNFYKIGMQLQFAGGLGFAQDLVAQGKKVFLDSKLLDIEQTISSAVENVAKMGVTFLTVHGMGKTIEAAVKGRGNSDLKILAVTVLTSMDELDLRDLGINVPVEEMVMMQTRKALGAGADGVIASALEVPQIRQEYGSAPMVITPGIRPSGAATNDQRRVATPLDAIRSGADYLVVGRPIIGAQDKRRAAESIMAEIEEGQSQASSSVISSQSH